MTRRRQWLAAAACVATGAASRTAWGQTAAVATTAPVAAPPAEVAAAVPAARLQGQGVLRFLGLRIYDARLWSGAQAVASDWADVPFALEIEYARGFEGRVIAARSLHEMQRHGAIEGDTGQRWLQAMQQFFPDVQAGDRITGVNLAGQGVRFFVNGKPRGDSAEPPFARSFFGIWLSPRSSDQALRLALLGRAA